MFTKFIDHSSERLINVNKWQGTGVHSVTVPRYVT